MEYSEVEIKIQEEKIFKLTANTTNLHINKTTIINLVTCQICSKLAISAQQCSNCEKTYCKSCLKNSGKRLREKCPNCYHYVFTPFNKLSLQLLNCLSFTCSLCEDFNKETNQSKPTVFNYTDFIDHSKTCKYSKGVCLGCGYENYMDLLLNPHVEICTKLVKKCESCQIDVRLKDSASHKNTCARKYKLTFMNETKTLAKGPKLRNNDQKIKIGIFERRFDCKERRKVVKEELKIWPFCSIGKIVGALDGSTFYGTGTLIAPNIVLTCAHNIYDLKKKKEATDLKFQLGFNDGYCQQKLSRLNFLLKLNINNNIFFHSGRIRKIFKNRTNKSPKKFLLKNSFFKKRDHFKNFKKKHN